MSRCDGTGQGRQHGEESRQEASKDADEAGADERPQSEGCQRDQGWPLKRWRHPSGGLTAGGSRLHAAVKRFHDGTERTVGPKQTLARVSPLRRALGITRIANLTGLDYIGIPVVAVYRPNARSLSVSQGKGATLDAACASGLMEAIELSHAEHIAQPVLWASLSTLRRRSRRIVDVDRLSRPRRSTFTAGKAIPWIEGRELLSGEPLLIPYELVHTDFRFSTPCVGNLRCSL